MKRKLIWISHAPTIKATVTRSIKVETTTVTIIIITTTTLGKTATRKVETGPIGPTGIGTLLDDTITTTTTNTTTTSAAATEWIGMGTGTPGWMGAKSNQRQ